MRKTQGIYRGTIPQYSEIDSRRSGAHSEKTYFEPYINTSQGEVSLES